MFPNPKLTCRKQIIFIPYQFHLEGAAFEQTKRTFFKGSQKARGSFFKPAVNVAAPFFRMGLEAKTKNPDVGQATTNISNSISMGNLLTNLHSNGFHMKVM